MQLIYDPAPAMAGERFRPDFAPFNPSCEVQARLECDGFHLTLNAAVAQKAA